MAWLLVLVAGLFETGFAVLLKQSHGITRLWPMVGFAVSALISFGLLNGGDAAMLEKARHPIETGAAGLIFGRNVRQPRARHESLRFVGQLREILAEYPW